MKRLVLLLVAVACFSLSAVAMAQDAGPKGGAPQAPKAGKRQRQMNAKRMELMWKAHDQVITKMTDLTADQRTSIAALDKRVKDSLKAETDNKSEDADTRRKNMMAAWKSYNGDLMKVFAKDQKKTYRTSMHAAMKEMSGRTGKKGAKGGGAATGGTTTGGTGTSTGSGGGTAKTGGGL
jgi:hypothetical protein